MKRTIIIGLVLLAAVVSAKDTVIYEAFDRYANMKWWDYWKCESTEGGEWGIKAREGSEKNLYLFYDSAYYEEHYGIARYHKELSLRANDRYKIQLDYCQSGYAGLVLVHLGSTTVGALAESPWTKFKATVTIKKTERGYFCIVVNGYDHRGLAVDNIIVEKCAIGIEPNSIGKIKALYE